MTIEYPVCPLGREHPASGTDSGDPRRMTLERRCVVGVGAPCGAGSMAGRAIALGSDIRGKPKRLGDRTGR
jgi:hypothetical protein